MMIHMWIRTPINSILQINAHPKQSRCIVNRVIIQSRPHPEYKFGSRVCAYFYGRQFGTVDGHPCNGGILILDALDEKAPLYNKMASYIEPST